MNRTVISLATLSVALLTASCAQEVIKTANDSDKAYFEAWMAEYYPDAVKTGLGSYIIEDHPGTGDGMLDQNGHPYILADYTMKKLDGTITGTTVENTARSWGKYDKTYFYGPTVLYRSGNNLNVGIEEALKGIRCGGRRVFAVPGWLMNHESYSSEQEYFDNVSGGTPMIYDITVFEGIPDVTVWETDSIKRYLEANFKDSEVTEVVEGKLFYIRTQAPDEGAEAFTSGNKVFINYTGRLLNGKVFDTTVEKTAWDSGIHKDKTYSPIQINWASEYSSITMGTNSTKPIEGFSRGLLDMKLGEKGILVIHSDLGYKSSGQGNTIPGFSPLRFDIEIVESE